MMSQNNLFADSIVKLKNAIINRTYKTTFRRFSNLFVALLRKLQTLGYVMSIELKDSSCDVELTRSIVNISFIRNQSSVSRQGLREYEMKLLPSRHRGHLLLTTSNPGQALLTSEEAREHGLGGILLAYVY